jgi:hypothetical protein
MIMTRHLMDHARIKDESGRLTRFLRLARIEYRHAATEALLRRPRSRNRPGGLIARWVKARESEKA